MSDEPNCSECGGSGYGFTESMMGGNYQQHEYECGRCVGTGTEGVGAVVTTLTATLAAKDAEIEALRDALEDHTTDWGDCDNPLTCICSHARALRLLAPPTPEPDDG